MLKAVMFDFDGTIGETMRICLESFRKAIEPLAGRTFSDEEIYAVFGPSDEGALRRLVPDRWKEAYTDFLNWYRLALTEHPEPFPGIKELLADLKAAGKLVVLVTGKGMESCMLSLECYGIADLFDMIEAGSPEGACKDISFRRVLERFHLEPQETVYIGDARSDILFARSVGIPIISAAWAETARPEELAELQPDQLFTSVEQLKLFFD